LLKRMERAKPKALALWSGGLDSMLAALHTQRCGIDVEAVFFITPFTKPMKQRPSLPGVPCHFVELGEEYLRIVLDPPHGYGSQVNPCIDCKILMLRRARELAERIGADFLVTGEVLGQRPFTQRFAVMRLIDREAGVEGWVVRPLSGKLLPPTEPEKRGMVKRKDMLEIRGRQRTEQLRMAKEMGLERVPQPAGGCILTDPSFSRRLREHIHLEKRLTLLDARLLLIGRHFRVGRSKVIVSRDEEEGGELEGLARAHGIPILGILEYMGPAAVVVGDEGAVETAAAIAARYSDAPRGSRVRVLYRSPGEERVLEVLPMSDEEVLKLRIG